MFQKVAFTMFAVTDPTRARNFYENVLGLTRGLAAPNGVWTEYDLPGGGCLALFCHPDPKFARSPGGASVAFEVADLDALNTAPRVRRRGLSGRHGARAQLPHVEHPGQRRKRHHPARARAQEIGENVPVM